MSFKMLAFCGLASVSGRTQILVGGWSDGGFLSGRLFFYPSFGINALI